MSHAVFGPFADAVAGRMEAAHVDLARQWLDGLRELLAIPDTAVFPSESLLDHIPGLICHIAQALRTADTALANTGVTTKAQELGNLRFGQEASVHQLLREYRLLGEILGRFVVAEAAALNSVDTQDAVALTVRLHDTVFVLMQTTVNTFVSRYSEMITEQTARLEGFSRMVSHELRQPLGTIRSAIDLVQSGDRVRLSADHERCLALIESNSRRMATLTTSLLTLSSLDSGSIQSQEVMLDKVVSDAVRQLSDMAAARQVVISTDVPAYRLFTDVARLELIIVNLTSNAIKYRDPKKPERVVRIGGYPEGHGVRLTVEDNGVGIPEEARERLFTGFFRAHPERDSELGSDGVGLGLAIVAECARHLRAVIEVQSRDGEGTSFHVRLPASLHQDPTTRRSPSSDGC